MKKKEVKKFIIFMIILAISFAGGLAIGAIIAMLKKDNGFDNLMQHLTDKCVVATPIVYFSLSTVLLIIIFILYGICNKQFKRILNLKSTQTDADMDLDDDEDETSELDRLCDNLDNKLNYPLILSNIMLILSMFLFSAIFCVIDYAGKKDTYSMLTISLSFVFFIGIYVVNIVIGRGCIEMTKKLNPEKEGYVFDTKFRDVWFNSCDEAQQLMIYKAGYVAFKRVSTACTILWIVSFVGMMIFKTGIYPVLVVCVIWMINSVSYMVEAAKLERYK